VNQGNTIPFVGQAGGIDPKGRYAVLSPDGTHYVKQDYVDGVMTSNAWTIGDPMGMTTEMKQFHVPITDFQKGAGCQDPAPTDANGNPQPNAKAINCRPNAMAQAMNLSPEDSFKQGLSEATFLIGAFAWALHYPTDVVTCADPKVDCHVDQHSSMFVNPPPVTIYLDDIVYDTQDPPAP
jgi:hypothetical protein